MAAVVRQAEARRRLRRTASVPLITSISPSRRSLAAAAVLLAAADVACQLSGGSLAVQGSLDELAHLLTMLFVLWAVGCRLDRPFAKAALLISVAIDLDHIPQYLGWYGLTQGTPRPYSHSLLTILIVLLVASWCSSRSLRAGGARWPRGSQICFGLAIGLGVHFCRDMAEPGSGVSLLWPVSYHSFSYPHWTYVVVMVLIGAVCVVRSARQGAVSSRAGSPAAAPR